MCVEPLCALERHRRYEWSGRDRCGWRSARWERWSSAVLSRGQHLQRRSRCLLSRTDMCRRRTLTGEWTCAQLCVSGTDCTTGCCEPLTTGTASVCAPALYCSPTCRSTGSYCLDNPGACCPNTTCAYTTLSATPSCSALCAFNSDCASGCCAPLGNGASVCADPSYCASNCLPAGTRPCGLGTDCCPGSYCISDAINQICLPLCTSNSQCSTGCCAAPNGNGVYVCTDPAYCP